jgi:hypothetical protein
MAIRSGLSAQFMHKDEASWGTVILPDRSLPFIKESMAASKERIDSDSIYANRRTRDTDQWDEGEIVAGGSVEMEFFCTGMGILLKHCFGNVVTAGAGPFTHTYTPGDLDAKSMTVQIGKTNRGGTVTPWNFYGTKVKEWELTVAAKQTAKFSMDFSSKDVDKDGTPALGTFTPAASLLKYKWSHASVMTVHGVSPKVKSVKLKMVNGIEDDRYFLGASSIEEQDEVDIRTITAEVEAEFGNETLFDAFYAGTEAAFALTLTRAPHSFAITGNCRLDGEAPVVEDRGKLIQKIPVTFTGDGTDASAITAVYTTSDAIP